jgi:copper chaperone
VSETLTFTVPGMSCGHCEAAVTAEVSAVPGVESVVVDLDAKRVDVSGALLDEHAIRGAIEEAGYEAA